jgi:hypothetical protein
MACASIALNSGWVIHMSKVIGHTQSGKAIYSTAAMYRGNPGVYGNLLCVLSDELGAHVVKAFADYTAQDHLDAAELHEAAAAKIKVPMRYDAGGKGNQQWRHQQAAKGHRAAVGLIIEVPAPVYTYGVLPSRKHAAN